MGTLPIGVFDRATAGVTRMHGRLPGAQRLGASDGIRTRVNGFAGCTGDTDAAAHARAGGKVGMPFEMEMRDIRVGAVPRPSPQSRSTDSHPIHRRLTDGPYDLHRYGGTQI